MQGNVCPANVQTGSHKFKQMMVESIPPSEEAITAVGINDGGSPGEETSFDADDRCKLILAITTRKYAIVCEACGFFAGGFRLDEQSDDTAS